MELPSLGRALFLRFCCLCQPRDSGCAGELLDDCPRRFHGKVETGGNGSETRGTNGGMDNVSSGHKHFSPRPQVEGCTSFTRG